jgi:hypothetical protein
MPVTEAEWLAEKGRAQMMVFGLLRPGFRPGRFHRTKAGKRKLRLFACACCRLVWHLLTDSRLRRAIEKSEAVAEGEADRADLEVSSREILDLTYGGYAPGDPGAAVRAAAHMALRCVSQKASEAAFRITTLPIPFDWDSLGGKVGEAALCDLIREVFGYPFRPAPAVDPAWLAWQGGTVAQLAQAAYEERQLPEGTLDLAHLAALADALEDAGCTDAELLGHLRSPGPHVRGCWAVDLVLGKE